MRIVAILAVGGVRPPGFQCQPMHAGAVTFRLPFVAGATINGLGRYIVIGVFLGEIGVAGFGADFS